MYNYIHLHTCAHTHTVYIYIDTPIYPHTLYIYTFIYLKNNCCSSIRVASIEENKTAIER